MVAPLPHDLRAQIVRAVQEGASIRQVAALMHPNILTALLIGSLLGGLATPVFAQRSVCRSPLKLAGGVCVASCPSGTVDLGRTCEPSTFAGQRTILAGEAGCVPPLKVVAGACVASCPGGYEDRGRTCVLRRD
jgi:hypothetical protein